jgi:hypothetical protein
MVCLTATLGYICSRTGKCVEMRLQGRCLYAELLADTEFQAVGDPELATAKKRQSPGMSGALWYWERWGCGVARWERHEGRLPHR